MSMNDVIIVLVFIQAEQEVLVRLLDVRYRLKWKSQRMYNTYGYNKCWKRHPQACDRGHLCHRKRSMCVGLSYFQHSAAPYLHRALGNFGALWIK